MKKTVETDIAIIGGGIAGLWLLNRLRKLGFSAILLESNTLGGDQTNKAQGIIHGGVKYALHGSVTAASQTMGQMPMVWKDCLKGHGEINLENVPVLSSQQYLWSTNAISSKLAGFFAGFALKSNMLSLSKESYPHIFQHQQFKGHVYSLDEIVLDAHALMRELMKPHQDVIFKIDPMADDQLKLNDANELVSLEIAASPMPSLQVKAQKYIFTAGSGNEIILKKLRQHPVRMQRRPLHMVMLKQAGLPSLFAHCLGMSTVPRITITTHQAEDGKPVWYIGGQIAEEGIEYEQGAQIEKARHELEELFPWHDFSEAQFTSFYVDRAENLQADGSRPHSCYMKEIGNIIVAWPTKLALAPLLSSQIIDCLTAQIAPQVADMRELRAWPIPALAKPIWDQLL